MGVEVRALRVAQLAALEWLDPGQQFDPEFLSALTTGSSAITLTKGEKRTHELRIR